MRTKSNKVRFFSFILVMSLFASLQAQVARSIYTSTSGQYYKSPAIAVAHNGNIVLVNEDRHAYNGTIGQNNDIDLLISYSSDNGATWHVGATRLNNVQTSCYANEAIVANSENGEMLLLFGGGTSVWYTNILAYISRSSDNGITWTTPAALTLDANCLTGVTGFRFASGGLFQSKVVKTGNYYRIYAVMEYSSNYTSGHGHNRVLYSDDFGTTWHRLGIDPMGGTGASENGHRAGEAKVAELPNGNVVVSSAYNGGRRFAVYNYNNQITATGSWSNVNCYPFTSGCYSNGDIIKVKAMKNGSSVDLLLQSSASGTTENTTKIFYSEVSANTTSSALSTGWKNSVVLPNTGSIAGNSAICLQADGRVGVFYEYGSPCTLAYVSYSLDQLTNNQYAFRLPLEVVRPDVMSYNIDIANHNITINVPEGARTEMYQTDFWTDADVQLTIENNMLSLKHGVIEENFAAAVVETAEIILPIEYVWNGSRSDNWFELDNWSVRSDNNLLVPADTLPTDNDNVIIPQLNSNARYPNLTSADTIRNLYIAPRASLGGQYYLNVTESVYTDIVTPTNQWTMLSMPLKQIYSGDFYTEQQGGVVPSEVFGASHYLPTEGNFGHNRVFPYAVSQRMLGNTVLAETESDGVSQYMSSWNQPNALRQEYIKAEAFELYVPAAGSTASFRMPSAEKTYSYYGSNGYALGATETLDRSLSGRFMYDDVNGDMLVQYENTSSTAMPVYAVGNPSFAHLSIEGFLLENAAHPYVTERNIAPYVYANLDNELNSDGEQLTMLYYLDENQALQTVQPFLSGQFNHHTMVSPFVAPTRGFRVISNLTQTMSLHFTPAMFDANPSVSQSANVDAAENTMEISVNYGGARANTIVKVQEHASNGFILQEDAALLDVDAAMPYLATLADGQLVAINTVADTSELQLVLNAMVGHVTMNIRNSGALGSRPYLYDAREISYTPIDSVSAELQLELSANDSPLRYSIRWNVPEEFTSVEAVDYADQLQVNAFTPQTGVLVVKANQQLDELRVFDANGKEIFAKQNPSEMTTVQNLPTGVYTIEAIKRNEYKTLVYSVK